MSPVLYIRHLPPLVTQRKLERLLSRYGDVLHVEVMANPDPHKKGCFAVVAMASESGARAALAASQRSEFFGGALSVRRATAGFARRVEPPRGRF